MRGATRRSKTRGEGSKSSTRSAGGWRRAPTAGRSCRTRAALAAFLDFDGFILATITETPEGPVAEGYQYVAGVEEVVPPVALAVTGPSREAYETGRPGLVRKHPWAQAFAPKG